MNIICLFSYKKKRLLEKEVEELDIRVGTYNLFKQLGLRTLKEVVNCNTTQRAFIEEQEEVAKDVEKLLTKVM